MNRGAPAWSSRSRPDTSMPSGCRSFKAGTSMTPTAARGARTSSSTRCSPRSSFLRAARSAAALPLATRCPRTARPVPWLTIVGVSPTVRQRRATDSDPVVFVPWAAGAPATGALVVRSGLDTTSLVATLRQQVQAVDATMPIFRARTLPQVRHDSDWVGRVSSRLLLFLTFIAVALATVGLYAVTAHGVSQQRHEIGIRMALGARPVPDRATRVAPRPGAGLHRIRRRDRLHGALGERLSFRRRRASCDRRRIAGHRGRSPAGRRTSSPRRCRCAAPPGSIRSRRFAASERAPSRDPWSVVRGPRGFAALGGRHAASGAPNSLDCTQASG